MSALENMDASHKIEGVHRYDKGCMTTIREGTEKRFAESDQIGIYRDIPVMRFLQKYSGHRQT